MTLDELKQLRECDRVYWRGNPACVGAVRAIDFCAVEIWWQDGTSSVIWFAHCEDGRDSRHKSLVSITRDNPAGRQKAEKSSHDPRNRETGHRLGPRRRD